MVWFLEDFYCIEHLNWHSQQLYTFAGMMPYFLEVDHVDFLRPVDVGDVLRLKSCVLYTESHNADQPLINNEVIAHVTRPELSSSEVCPGMRLEKASNMNDSSRKTRCSIRRAHEKEKRGSEG